MGAGGNSGQRRFRAEGELWVSIQDHLFPLRRVPMCALVQCGVEMNDLKNDLQMSFLG